MFRTVPSRAVFGLLLVGALLSASHGLADPSVPQLDDFESGSTHGWTGNTGSGPLECHMEWVGPPINGWVEVCLPTEENGAQVVAEPLPSSNHYLLLSGITVNPAVETWNTASNHTGNFFLLGVRKIAMDLNTPSPDEPLVRVGIQGGDTQWVTSDAYAFGVPQSQWSHREFLLFEPFMTRVSGTESLTSTLSSVSEIRIIHAEGAQWQGDAGPDIGIDNVELPEPGTVAGSAAGAALLALIARRRRTASPGERPLVHA